MRWTDHRPPGFEPPARRADLAPPHRGRPTLDPVFGSLRQPAVDTGSRSDPVTIVDTGPRRGRWLLGIVAALLLVTLAPAAAEAHGVGANGCTGVPDSGYGFAFHGPCDRHDRCYRTRPYGDDQAARGHCDRVFRDEMRRYCQRHGVGLRRASCESVAAAYHAGVRTLGLPFWLMGRASPIV